MPSFEKCERGFILIATALQLPILIGLTMACFAVFSFNREVNRNLVTCVGDAITAFSGKMTARTRNFEIKNDIFRIDSTTEVQEWNDEKKLKKLKTNFHGSGLITKLNWTNQYICGAEVLCFKEKCQLKVVADKY